MRIIARKALREFWENPKYADAEEPLKAWYELVSKADWAQPSDIKAIIRSVSIVGDGRAVFNIGGNKYRLIVRINYPYRVVYIRFIGTHRQYDAINAKEI